MIDVQSTSQAARPMVVRRREHDEKKQKGLGFMAEFA